MNQCEGGGTLLLALFCTAFIMVICTNFWKAASLMKDLACKKESYEQRFRATEGLLEWGIGVAKSHFESTTLPFHGWPVGDCHSYEGFVELERRGQAMAIRAQLILEGDIVCSLACILCRKIEKIENKNEDKVTYSIQSWTEE